MNIPILSGKRRYQHLLLLTVSVLAVFGNSLLNGFVWDDKLLLLGREVYKNFDLAKIMFSPANELEYLPLRDLTLAVDYVLWGERPFGFHLTNLLLHLGGVWAVYYLVSALENLFGVPHDESSFEPGVLAFICALLFAVHPVQSQAVSFVAARNTILAAMFAFLAAGFYLRSLEYAGARRWGFVAFGALSFLCALVSKAAVVSVPLALATAWFLLYRARREKLGSITTLGPFFIFAAIFYFVHSKVAIAAHTVNERLVFSYPLPIKIATAVQIPFFYLAKLVLPVGLSPEYDVQFATSFAVFPVIASVVGLILVAVLFLKTVKSFPIAAFGIAWFFGTLIPVLNFYVTNPTVADRYAYLPSMGFFCALVAFFPRVTAMMQRRAIFTSVALLTVLLGLMTASANRVWKNEKTLWEEAIRVSPRQPKGYANLASDYFDEGAYDKAFQTIEKARDLDARTYAHRYLFEGGLLARRGDYKAAVDAYRKGLEFDEEFCPVLFGLAQAHEAMGDYEDAVAYYNRTLGVRTNEYGGYRQRSQVALARLSGRIAPRLAALKGKLAENPSDQATRIELAVNYDHLGMYEEAVTHYQQFLNRDQGRWEVYFNLGNIYKKQEKYPEASQAYRQSLNLNPAYGDTWNNLGAVLKERREYDQAIEAYNTAISYDPTLAFAFFNRGVAYFLKNDRDNAIRSFKETKARFPAMKGRIAIYMKILGVEDGKNATNLNR